MYMKQTDKQSGEDMLGCIKQGVHLLSVEDSVFLGSLLLKSSK